ncbi:MAG: hypothetical protein WD426_10165 [Anditalea sp.]
MGICDYNFFQKAGGLYSFLEASSELAFPYPAPDFISHSIRRKAEEIHPSGLAAVEGQDLSVQHLSSSLLRSLISMIIFFYPLPYCSYKKRSFSLFVLLFTSSTINIPTTSNFDTE